MAHFCKQGGFWLLILAAPSLLCKDPSFGAGDGVRSVQTRREAGIELRERSRSQDGEAQGRAGTLKFRTDMVTISVSVTDKDNNFVPSLSPEDFQVFEDGISQNVIFFSGEDIPLNIGILLDTSGSVRRYFDKFLQAARELIQTSHRDDDFFFLTFSNKVTVHAQLANGDAADEGLHLPEPEGGTAFYDSIYFALENVKQGRHGRHALVIISDGQENCSRYSYKELMKLVKEAGVQVFCIGIGDTFGEGSFATGGALLKQLAKMTGGKTFFPRRPDDIEGAVSDIALLLRHQYSIGYYPTNLQRDGRWRKLKVRLLPSERTQNLRVSVRAGYYALP